MRALAALLLVVLVAPAALAQTIGQPLSGTYENSYTVYGRAIDSRGDPVRGGVALIEFEQKGLKMEPLRAGINCKGDFIAEFNLLRVDPAGKVKVTVLGLGGRDNATARAPLDPFYRRSDVLATLPGVWGQDCKNEVDVWEVSASMRVRILNRSEPYLVEGEQMHARPSKAIFKMRYEPPGGGEPVQPPHPQDPRQAELFQPDVRGDIRYTFTLDIPFEGGGVVRLISVQDENQTYSIPIDPVSRLGVKYFEESGRGPPDGIYDTPGAGVALLVGSLALAAMAFSRRRL